MPGTTSQRSHTAPATPSSHGSEKRERCAAIAAAQRSGDPSRQPHGEATWSVGPVVTTIAARNDATLHLLFVADELPETIDPRSSGLSAEAEESALEFLADTASQLDYDDVISTVEAGSVPHVICSCAREHDADLITMGTHGWSGFDRFLLGSFTERVVQTAPVPVLTTKVRKD